MDKCVKSGHLDDQDHVILQKAELVAGFLQTVTRGPGEGFTVLLNATLMLCRVCAVDENNEHDTEMLRQHIKALIADWQSVYDELNDILKQESTL